MKYTVKVYDSQMGDVSLESDGTTDKITLDLGSQPATFTLPEFKEFRRALGYVWQEVQQNG